MSLNFQRSWNVAKIFVVLPTWPYDCSTLNTTSMMHLHRATKNKTLSDHLIVCSWSMKTIFWHQSHYKKSWNVTTCHGSSGVISWFLGAKCTILDTPLDMEGVSWISWCSLVEKFNKISSEHLYNIGVFSSGPVESNAQL